MPYTPVEFIEAKTGLPVSFNVHHISYIRQEVKISNELGNDKARRYLPTNKTEIYSCDSPEPIVVEATYGHVTEVLETYVNA